MILIIVPIVIILLPLLVTIYIQNKLDYWKRRDIPYVKPLPLVGNLKDLFSSKISFGELFQRLYEDEHVKSSPAGGIYLLHQPALILRDADLIKSVLIKNFDKFQNRYEAADAVHDAMGSLTLPLSKYSIWRGCRKKMSEMFTTGKIKLRMYPLMLDVVKELECFLSKKLQSEKGKGAIIEVKEMFSLFTTDLTSILHYGVDVKGLKQGHSILRQQTLDLFNINLIRLFDFFMIFFLPHLTLWVRAKVFSKSYMEFMRNFTSKICKERSHHSTSLKSQGDLFDVLLKFQAEYQEDPLHYSQHKDFIASQVAIFLLAGFETSSSVLGFILYELAKQPDIQQKLRQELKEGFGEKTELSYEELQALPYLQMVLCEGLRMYPAAAFINRECTAVYGFQLNEDIFVPHGMPVYVSILGLHRDPKYWPEPDHFNPERFSSMANINPMIYQPFGTGPHACIGSRLGLLQVKLALAHTLRLYYVQTCSRTVKNIKFDPKSFMLQAKGGIYLKFFRDE
ncbi:probable cytochrome P450 6t3 [Musca vetustissima]|uniref:probable cytochrome P450 6t3 n=1 Tax=Musca vetustissima TaxID=27455 RepID=UPI002AB6A4A0|nr:probable cytochrome P450 6t3 [Musca vetustissima]